MQRRFKQFVLVGIVLTVIIELFAWLYVPADPVLADFYFADGYDALVEGGYVLYFLILAIRISIMVGLLAFHRTARTLFLAYVPLTAISTILWGYRVSAPIVGPFYYLESVFDGIILALAFYSSISPKFGEGAT